MSCSPSLYKNRTESFILFLQKWTFVLTLVQVLPKQLIAVTVKIADQIVPILNYQVPALALHLQRKHVASKVNATLERSFSQMKLIKTRLHNALSDCSLSHLMKIAIEAPEVLSDSDLDEIVNVWQRKSRRVSV